LELEYALKLAKPAGAKVVLLTVVEKVPASIGLTVSAKELEEAFRKDAEGILSNLVQAAEKEYGLTPSAKIVKPGHSVETILEVAKSEGVDLIVMGNRGRGSLKETILGSVSHRL
jgi:nucleotide-binding universal stress UspA family protein